MRALAVALALSSMLTVEQRDPRRAHLDPPSAAVSADGRYVAFTTFSQLARADINDCRDVYVLDRGDNRVTLESAPPEASRSFDSAHPAISGDGRFLIYEMASQIALRDRREDSTRILGEGRQPSISLDGRVAAFTSDTAGDIMVWNIENGTLSSLRKEMRLETGSAPVNPSLDKDGRLIVFSARGSIYIHDRQTHTTELIAGGWDAMISADGRYIAYVSRVGKTPNVLLMDRTTGKSQVVSRSAKNRDGNGPSVNPAISGDGRLVAYQSEASNLVEGDDFNLLWDVFVFDRERMVTLRVSGDPDAGWMEPSGGPAVDAGGDLVAFSSRHPTDVSDKKNDFDLFVASVR
jgi:Tol biopolymer transport system component